jgi:hypothetical protein
MEYSPYSLHILIRAKRVTDGSKGDRQAQTAWQVRSDHEGSSLCTPNPKSKPSIHQHPLFASSKWCGCHAETMFAITGKDLST